MKKRNAIARVYTWVTFTAAGVMVTFRLLSCIKWSWWLVTAPLWFNLLAAVALVIWAKIYLRK